MVTSCGQTSAHLNTRILDTDSAPTKSALNIAEIAELNDQASDLKIDYVITIEHKNQRGSSLSPVASIEYNQQNSEHNQVGFLHNP